MDIDPGSETWRAIAAWAEKRESEHRQKLEGPLTERQSDVRRGALQMIKELRALGTQTPATEAPSDGLPGPEKWFGVFGD